MVFFSTTGLLLHVALFRLGTTHDCAISQAGPSIWSRLPPAIPTEVFHGADRARGRARPQPVCCAAYCPGASAREGPPRWGPLLRIPSHIRAGTLGPGIRRRTARSRLAGGSESITRVALCRGEDRAVSSAGS